MKKIAVIGAGPGGLAAAALLANRGFDVHVYEREERVGGRNGKIEEAGYTFDIGPTFFMMPFILKEIFAECGEDLNDYVELKMLEPYYQLVYADGSRLFPGHDFPSVKDSIREICPGDASGFAQYMADNDRKMDRVFPVLQKPYGTLSEMFSRQVLGLLPVLKPLTSLWDELGHYFNDDRVKVGFTFQSKYLGMSPQSCPSMFSILPYIEYKWGIYHVMGGLNRLAGALAGLVEKLGGAIHLGTDVEEVDIRDGKARGIVLEGGRGEAFDELVLNADFAWGMRNLIPDAKRRKYTDRRLDAKRYSCSTFMLYLGLDREYDHLMHHNVYIAGDYEQNFRDIEQDGRLSNDPSIYVHNPSVTDPSMAPPGHTALYVLVPVANLKAEIDWEHEKGDFRGLVLDMLEKRAGLEDIEDHIRFEKMITPPDWERDRRVGYGACFNLAHNLSQMLYFRPHNQFEEFENMWLVGGGTSPGSGLPTIYESGRITAGAIAKRYASPVSAVARRDTGVEKGLPR